jgi:hypothetical protein
VDDAWGGLAAAFLFLDGDFLDGDFLDGDFIDGDFLDGDMWVIVKSTWSAFDVFVARIMLGLGLGLAYTPPHHRAITPLQCISAFYNRRPDPTASRCPSHIHPLLLCPDTTIRGPKLTRTLWFAYPSLPVVE